MKTLNILGQNVLIDDEDEALVNQYNWTISLGYARQTAMPCRKMHVIVLGLTDANYESVDHKDGNKLNNQKSNLRICTHAENKRNVGKIKSAITSKYKGVNWMKRRGYFIARITVDYKTIFLWSSKVEEECAFAYNVACKLLHKEFGILNTIEFQSDFIEQQVTELLKDANTNRHTAFKASTIVIGGNGNG